MIFEYISLILGFAKISIFKVFNFSKVRFSSFPKMNNSFKIAMKKGTKLNVGKNFRTRNNVSFRIYNRGTVKIGDNCFFNDGCSINCQQNIQIGNNVIMGQNVLIFDHDHDYKNNINEFIKKDVSIGNNVWIGANVIILKGTTIGNNVVIAAGTTIKENIANNSFVYQEKTNKIKEREKNV